MPDKDTKLLVPFDGCGNMLRRRGVYLAEYEHKSTKKRFLLGTYREFHERLKRREYNSEDFTPVYKKPCLIEAKSFEATLTVEKYSRDNQDIVLTDSKGCAYYMDINDFVNYIKKHNIVRGMIVGEWGFKRDGYEYRIVPVYKNTRND